ncbi:hypothetical protein D6817_01395 [Candidatus Pacearchaeota archaeon]|nr:MAG: hypothetical protein D6817_01395 [Candidatus Pacearchaeota archaeon]
MGKLDVALRALWLAAIFMLGVVVGANYFSSFGITKAGGVTALASYEVSDFLDSDNIDVFPDKIEIKIPNAQVRGFADTGSMGAMFGKSAQGIFIPPKSADEINVGDIVSFRQKGALIVHRVIEKGRDEQGVYFLTKGDASPAADGKIRFEQIEGLLVGVIY